MQFKRCVHNIKGAFYIEYAILLAFAIIFCSFAKFDESVKDLASSEINNSNINKTAYTQTVVVEGVASNNGGNSVNPEQPSIEPSEPVIPVEPEPNKPVITYSENLVKDYSINKGQDNIIVKIIRGILSLFINVYDEYSLNPIDLEKNSTYEIFINPTASTTVNNREYKLSEFYYTYSVTYRGTFGGTSADKNNSDSGMFEGTDWKVEINTGNYNDAKLNFSFDYKYTWDNDVETALKNLLENNMTVKKKTVTNNS